ncbi:N-acetylmuramoyl-L-alanine amidase [bacterium]|nr:N-acetylmuramoyl-L-alanine amidase [bacterium]
MKTKLSFFLLFILFSFALAFQFDGSTAVELPAGTVNMSYLEIDGNNYTTSDQIAEIGDKRFYSAIKRKESISIGGESFTFSPNNEFVIVAERTYKMPLKTRILSDAILIPLEAFLEILADRSLMSLENSGGKYVFSVKKNKSTKPKTVTSVISTEHEAYEEDKKIVAVPADENEAATPIRKKKWYVMIDPGHGGKDPGASAKDGTREKKLVLDISKRIAKILKDDTLFTVEITRNEDVFLPLSKRTDLANSNNADLFISIHCNAAKNKSARGTQVFFLAPARSDHARATAALENSSIFLEEPSEGTDDLDFIMTDIIQNEFLRESSRLAVLIEEAISTKTSLPARGPAGAGFYVLKGSFMPAVLVETAFLSNPDDAKLLSEGSFREKLAVGITEGIRQFIVELP